MNRVYWLAQTAGEVPAADDWMAAGETSRAERMRIPKRRSDYRLGRWTARRALTACPDIPAGMFEVCATVSGAPEVLIEGRRALCAISLSHSAGAALCAISPTGGRLGCDLEVIEPRSREFIETFFTEREQIRIEQEPLSRRALLATIIWSAKESALKALGEGLRLDTRSVEVTLSSNERSGLWQTMVVIYGEDLVLSGWWRRCGSHALTIIASPPPEAPLELTPYPGFSQRVRELEAQWS